MIDVTLRNKSFFLLQLFWLLNFPFDILQYINLHRIWQGYAAVKNILMKLLEVIKYSTTPPKPKYPQGAGKGYCFTSSKMFWIFNKFSQIKIWHTNMSCEKVDLHFANSLVYILFLSIKGSKWQDYETVTTIAHGS